MSDFFNQFGGDYNPNPRPQPRTDSYGILGKINEFAKTVQNPQQQVEQLLQSGQMTQEQFQQYAQIAKMLTNHR